MKNYIFLIPAILTITSCSRCNSQKSSKLQDTVTMQQDSLNKIVKEKEETYRQKDNKALIGELEVVVLKGKEPFNSLAFREIIKRKDAAPELFSSIKTTGQKEYFKIMALKKIDAGVYKRLSCDSICAILATALQRSTLFNGWGLPNLYWETSAKSIIECGQNAIPFLKPLLKDTTPAPVWGSEEAQEYEKYRYRVRDYAYALIMEIVNQKSTLPENALERDRIIDAYLNKK